MINRYRIESLERELAQLRRRIDRLIAEARHKRPANLDALIDNLLAEERKVEQESRSQIKAANRLLTIVPATYKRAVGPLMRRMTELLTAQMETLRDARWQLMVIRADGIPEGRGPVFDDPTALRRYARRWVASA